MVVISESRNKVNQTPSMQKKNSLFLFLIPRDSSVSKNSHDKLGLISETGQLWGLRIEEILTVLSWNTYEDTVAKGKNFFNPRGAVGPGSKIAEERILRGFFDNFSVWYGRKKERKVERRGGKDVNRKTGERDMASNMHGTYFYTAPSECNT